MAGQRPRRPHCQPGGPRPGRGYAAAASANLPLLFLLLILALLFGLALCLGLAQLGLLEFSPFAFGAAGRVVLILPTLVLVLGAFLSTRSDAEYICEQLLDRHLILRDPRRDRSRWLPPGPATEQFVRDRLKRSAAWTSVLMVCLVGGIAAGFGGAAKWGCRQVCFPLGDVGLIAVLLAAVRGMAALRDLAGTHSESSATSEGPGYVAPARPR